MTVRELRRALFEIENQESEVVVATESGCQLLTVSKVTPSVIDSTITFVVADRDWAL